MKKTVLFSVGILALLGYLYYLMQQAKKNAIDQQLIIDDFNRYLYGEIREKLARDTNTSEAAKRTFFKAVIEPNKKTYLRPRAEFLKAGNPGYEGVIFNPAIVDKTLNSIG